MEYLGIELLAWRGRFGSNLDGWKEGREGEREMYKSLAEQPSGAEALARNVPSVSKALCLFMELRLDFQDKISLLSKASFRPLS